MQEFMVFTGWPEGVECPNSEALVETLAGAHFNAIMWDKSKLELCRKYNLKLMVTDATPEEARELTQEPMLWGYYIFDEPQDDQFPDMAAQAAPFRDADPHHPVYVNLLSQGGDYLRDFMEIVRPQVLSYDWYQWWWGNEKHYSRLERYREAAMLADIPLICWQEVNANPGTEWGNDASHLPDNAQRIRQSVFTALAYGVKGIEWFTADIMFEHGTAELNECGRDVAAINADLVNLGAILFLLRSVAVFNTPPVPRGTREAPPDHWVEVTGEFGGAGLVVGVFRDEEKNDYLLLANRDYRHSQQADLLFHSGQSGAYKIQSVERFVKATGRWIEVPRAKTNFSLNLLPGDGELIKVRRSR